MEAQDLKSDNILVGLKDESILENLARDEFEHPLPQKMLEDRTIYLSRNDLDSQTKDSISLAIPYLQRFYLSSDSISLAIPCLRRFYLSSDSISLAIPCLWRFYLSSDSISL